MRAARFTRVIRETVKYSIVSRLYLRRSLFLDRLSSLLTMWQDLKVYYVRMKRNLKRFLRIAALLGLLLSIVWLSGSEESLTSAVDANAVQVEPPIRGVDVDRIGPRSERPHSRRRANSTLTISVLRLYFCPREWIGNYLLFKKSEEWGGLSRARHGDVHGIDGVRGKMGELRQWLPLYRSFRDLGCEVKVSMQCNDIEDFFALPVPTSTEAIPLLFLEDLWLQPLRQLHHCDKLLPSTVVTAWESSPFVPTNRTLFALSPRQDVHQASSELPLASGIDAFCPFRHSMNASDTDDIRISRRRVGLLWGKRKQQGEKVVPWATEVSGIIPLIATCIEQCNLPTNSSIDNLGAVSKEKYDELLATSLFILGLKSPDAGATVVEALSCGTPVIARPSAIPIMFRSHPLVFTILHRKDVPRLVKSVLEMWESKGSISRPTNGSGKASIEANVSLPSYFHPLGHRSHIAALFGLKKATSSCHLHPNFRSAPMFRMLKSEEWPRGCLRRAGGT